MQTDWITDAEGATKLTVPAFLVIADPDRTKALLKPQYHEAYDRFRELDVDSIWDHFDDPQYQIFWPITKSDETYYCMMNGGYNDEIFNELFDSLDTGDKIDLVDAWIEQHQQEM